MTRFLLGVAAVSLLLLGWHPVVASALGFLGALASLVGMEVVRLLSERAKTARARESQAADIEALKSGLEELRQKVVPLLNSASFRPR